MFNEFLFFTLSKQLCYMVGVFEICFWKNICFLTLVENSIVLLLIRFIG